MRKVKKMFAAMTLVATVVFSLTGCAGTVNHSGEENVKPQETVQETEPQEVVSEEPEETAAVSDAEMTAPEADSQEPDTSENETETVDEQQITYSTGDFTVQLPKSWEGHYIAREFEEGGFTWVGFSEKKCHEQIDGGGWLFSIAAYGDTSYEEQPSYEVIDTDGDITYVVIYPTDVQFIGASKKAQKRYVKMAGQIDDIIATFKVTNKQ